MNIEDERKKEDKVYFTIIKVGKAFQCDNNIYMKVDINNDVNAVDLLNGTGRFLQPDIEVIPLDAKVVIQNYI